MTYTLHGSAYDVSVGDDTIVWVEDLSFSGSLKDVANKVKNLFSLTCASNKEWCPAASAILFVSNSDNQEEFLRYDTFMGYNFENPLLNPINVDVFRDKFFELLEA